MAVRILRPVLVVAAVAIWLVAGVPARPPAAAQPEPDWTPAGLAGLSVRQIFGPASGAFFAWAAAPDGKGLYRSEDGGATWLRLQLPPDATLAQPDPLDHGTLWAAAPGGLYRATGVYRSGDPSAAWALVLPIQGETVRAFAISPVDPALLYLASSRGTVDLRLRRSRDAGATWDTVVDATTQGGPCAFQISLLAPHPGDARRVGGMWGCWAGRDFVVSHPVRQSFDQGDTWADWFTPGTGLFATRLVGAAGRLYAAGYGYETGWLWRGDEGPDASATAWREILAVRDRRSVNGIAVDPANPDRLWVAVTQTEPAPANGSVRFSPDGGATWATAGRPLPPINDLLLGIDGRNLYAATQDGVWRLPLP